MAKTFNLTALSERLMTESRLKPLVGKIRRVQDLASLHTDLAIALDSMDALDVLVATPDTSDINRHVTEAALLNSAIMLYARATKTTSKQRRNFDLRTRFSPEELVVHEELVDLRDEAIAHFGFGGSYQGLWHVEVVILQTTKGNARPGVVTRRQMRDKKLIARARKQIELAHSLIRQISDQKINEMTDELNKMDPDLFQREISKHPLNLEVAIASKDAADIVRSSADQGGYIRGVVRG